MIYGGWSSHSWLMPNLRGDTLLLLSTRYV